MQPKSWLKESEAKKLMANRRGESALQVVEHLRTLRKLNLSSQWRMASKKMEKTFPFSCLGYHRKCARVQKCDCEHHISSLST